MAGSALKAMVSFFTIWPTDMTQEDMDAMDSHFHLAPVVGAMIGFVVLIELAILSWLQMKGVFGSSMFSAAAVLTTVYVGSRFLHFDGLADFGDGSIVAGSQERHVKALKDTLIGAGGLGVALCVTLLNFSVYAMAGIFLLILAPVVEIAVKNAQVATAAFGEPSNGMAGRQVAQTDVGSLVRSSVISLVLGIVISVIGIAVFNLIFGENVLYAEFSIAVLAPAFAVAASVVVGYLMARRCDRVFGFVNGDVLGASHEICRFAAMALIIPICMW